MVRLCSTHVVAGLFLACFATFLGPTLVVSDSDDETEEEQWHYFGMYGPGNWSAISSECSGIHHHQSPIDIFVETSRYSEILSTISLSPVHSHNNSIMAVNNGHTIGFTFQEPILVYGGELSAFKVGGAHFHWGKDDYSGSEHAIDGLRYPLEMHIVTYNEAYDGVVQASGGINSLAVLGVQFHLSPFDNELLHPIIAAVTKAQNKTPGYIVNVTHFELKKLLPDHTDQYYRYEGSLTTPPCSENVIWTIFRHTVPVSSAQLAQFRLLIEGPPENGKPDYLSHNWRPLQKLDGRVIHRSFPLPIDNRGAGGHRGGGGGNSVDAQMSESMGESKPGSGSMPSMRQRVGFGRLLGWIAAAVVLAILTRA